jgi:oligopeptide transport system substrate-binding protein
LLSLDPKTLQPVPAAAKEMPTVSADGRTYRFSLRDDGKYSDGSPVTARDFAHAFTRACDPGLKAFYAVAAYVIVGCSEWSSLDIAKTSPEQLRAAKQRLTTDGVRAIGDKELEITLTEPASYFPAGVTLFTFSPTREVDVIRGGQSWTEPATYIGNGPYALTTWKHTEKLVFAPNRYYRSPAKLRTWTKVIISEPAVAFAAYRHDEIDALFLGGGIAPDAQAALDTDKALRDQLITIGSNCAFYVAFNMRKPPFDDQTTRLAFAKALDRDSYVRDVVNGQGVPATSLIPGSLPGHDPDDVVQRFDPAEARRLLASGRYANAVPAVTAYYNPVILQQAARAKWLRDQWKANLGVEVQLVLGDNQGSIGQLYRQIETIPQVTQSMAWCADYPDPQNWLSLLFDSKSTSSGSVRNTGFSDTEFDRLVRQADRERDAGRRIDLYRQASRVLTSKAVIAPLSYGVSRLLVKPWLKGFVPSSFDFEVGYASGYAGVYVSKRKR